MAAAILCVRLVLVGPPATAAMVLLAEATFVAWMVIVGWVRVVLIVVRIVGDNAGHRPIGLFQIIAASVEASLFNSSSVEWLSLTGW